MTIHRIDGLAKRLAQAPARGSQSDQSVTTSGLAASLGRRSVLRAGAAALGALTLGRSRGARAADDPDELELMLCNQTEETVWAAVHYQAYAPPVQLAPGETQLAVLTCPQDGDWVTEGWFRLEPCGGCRTVVSLGEASSYYHYYFAESSSRTWDGTDTYQYVSDGEAFTDCAYYGSNYQRQVGFTGVNAEYGKLIDLTSSTSTCGPRG